jgi:hypothetical protein
VIPPFDPATGSLPPGIHEATWDEVVTRYGYNTRRRELLAGLRAAMDALQAAGCKRVYLDGSFVSAKELPGDFDACWEIGGVNFGILDPVLKFLDLGRVSQRVKYGGDLFPAEVSVNRTGIRFLEYFQRDKDTQAPKGIIVIDLEAEHDR